MLSIRGQNTTQFVPWSKNLAGSGKRRRCYLLDVTLVELDCTSSANVLSKQDFSNSLWDSLSNKHLDSWRREVNGTVSKTRMGGGKLVLYRLIKSSPELKICVRYSTSGSTEGCSRSADGLSSVADGVGEVHQPKTSIGENTCTVCIVETENQ